MTEPTASTDKKPIPTPGQIAEMKGKMLKSYQEQIEFLRVQSEYEELQARIMEARARQARAEVIIAQIYAPESENSDKEPGVNKPIVDKPEMAQSEEGGSKDTVFRKLKTEIPTK